MMLRAAALALMLGLAPPRRARRWPRMRPAPRDALQEAIAALDTAQGARDRVAALTRNDPRL
jgi:phage terminase Nu1 subunit (DNA packaging protein)